MDIRIPMIPVRSDGVTPKIDGIEWSEPASPPSSTADVAVPMVPNSWRPDSLLVALCHFPVADFLPDSGQFSTTDTIQFTSQAEYAESLMWNFGGFGTDAETGPAFQFTEHGTHDIELAVSNPAGNDSIIYALEFFDPPQPVIAYTADGLDVDFFDAGSGDVTTWAWSFGDGDSGAGRLIAHEFAADGTYDVELDAANPVNSAKTTLTLELYDYPAAGFEVDPVCCEDTALTDQSTGTITGWLWSFGDGETSSAQHPDHSYTSGGTYDIELIVENPSGSDSASASVEIYMSPAAAFLFATDGLDADFSDMSSGDITTWAWSFGDGETSSAQHPDHSYTGAGDYDVELVVENPICATDSAQQTVTISAVPEWIDTSDNDHWEVSEWYWDGGSWVFWGDIEWIDGIISEYDANDLIILEPIGGWTSGFRPTKMRVRAEGGGCNYPGGGAYYSSPVVVLYDSSGIVAEIFTNTTYSGCPGSSAEAEISLSSDIVKVEFYKGYSSLCKLEFFGIS